MRIKFLEYFLNKLMYIVHFKLMDFSLKKAPDKLLQNPRRNRGNWISTSSPWLGRRLSRWQVLTGKWGRGTRPLALALSCISLRCCFRYRYGGIPSLRRQKGHQVSNRRKGKAARNGSVLCVHAAVSQWEGVGVARHALLLAVVGAGRWSSGVAHVSVVWVDGLPPRPVREQGEQENEKEGEKEVSFSGSEALFTPGYWQVLFVMGFQVESSISFCWLLYTS